MSRYAGKIGFAQTKDCGNGVWKDEIVERMYYGDSYRHTRRNQSTDSVNDNLIISNEISIVVDPFASANFHLIRYAEFMGIKLKVSNIDIQYPRLVLTLGEVWHDVQ